MKIMHTNTAKKFDLRRIFIMPLITVLLMMPLLLIPGLMYQNQIADAASVTYQTGVTTVGSRMDSGNHNGISATQVTTQANAGELSSISVYIGKVNSSPLNHMRVALYADNGADAPGDLLATSNAQVLKAKSWNVFPMSQTSITANTKYWLAFNVDGSRTEYAIANNAQARSAWKIPTTYGTWPNPFGLPTEPITAQQYSLYMTYTSTPTPTVEPTPTAVLTPTIAPSGEPTPTVTPNPADRIFTGDFETGNVHQWVQCQAVFMNSRCYNYDNTHYGMQTQTAVKRQGEYATRFELRDGDIPSFGGGERSEVNIDVARTRADEGQDTWYQWSTQFAPNFPYAGWGAVVSQWHDDSNNPPPLGFYALNSTTWGFKRNDTNRVPYILWTTPINPGQWEDIKIHIMWSSNPSIGYIELWLNGVRQTFTGSTCAGQTRCYTATRGFGGHYFKQGYYRDQATTATGAVYHDGFTVSSTEAGLGSL